MKKILLSIVSVISLCGFAQNSFVIKTHPSAATITPNSTINISVPASSNHKYTIDLTNTSGSNKSYNAKRYDVVLNSGADAYFCFAGTCYDPSTIVSPTPLSLAANQSASQLSGNFNMLVADLDEPATTGLSVIKYTFYNTSMVSDSIQVTLRYNGTPSSIKKNNITNESLNLSPNPCNNFTTLKFESNSDLNTDVKIYNSVGALVSENSYKTTLGTNSFDLDLDNYLTGVYFVSIINGNSKATKKLIVK